MSYLELDPTHIIATLERLCQRIESRFPDAALGGVGRELLGLARASAREAAALGRPHWPIRIAAGLAIVVMLASAAFALTSAVERMMLATHLSGVSELVQVVESGINDVVFLGIAVYFLLSIETRTKRRVALHRMHQLRSIAHIVDMHQLTKDPDQLSEDRDGSTAATPGSARRMTGAALARYLDYCSELLSLTGKVGALFVQRLDDPSVLQSVNEIEDLTNGLSRKIWQKITLLDRSGSLA